jgi:sec-independent protein translocase protein TatA
MRNIGPLEITMIILVLVLLFGAKRLPDLARSTGRSLRIFKAETKGLLTDDDDGDGEETKSAIDAQRSTAEAKPVAEPEHRPEDV